MKTKDVKVSVKVGGKSYEKTANLSIVPESIEDVQKLAATYGTEDHKKNPLSFLFDAATNFVEYARGVRTGMRNQILQEIEGPDKAIAKTAKLQFELGLYDSLEEALAETTARFKARQVSKS